MVQPKKVINKNVERAKARYDKKPTERNANRVKKAELAKEFWDRQTKDMTIEDTLKLMNRFDGNKLSQWKIAQYTIEAVNKLPIDKIKDSSIKKVTNDLMRSDDLMRMQQRQIDEQIQRDMQHQFQQQMQQQMMFNQMANQHF